MHIGVHKTCLPYNHDLVGLHVCGPSLTLNEPWNLPQYPLLAERARPNEAEEAEEPDVATADYDGPRVQVNWQQEPFHTDMLVQWLIQHPADSTVLFNSKCNVDHGTPLGKDKNEIQGLITHFIFMHDHKYGSLYASFLDKFRDSVAYRISTLKKVWRPLYDKLRRTGAGVVPLDANAAANLKGAYEIDHDCPWFDNLRAIWGSNLSFAAPTISSQPGVDHAAHFFSLISTADAGNASSQVHSTPPSSALMGSPAPPHTQGGRIADHPQQSGYSPSSTGPSVSGSTGALPQLGYPPPSSGTFVGGSSQSGYLRPSSGAFSSGSASLQYHYSHPADGSGASPQFGSPPPPSPFAGSPTSSCPPPFNPCGDGSAASSPQFNYGTPPPPSTQSSPQFNYGAPPPPSTQSSPQFSRTHLPPHKSYPLSRPPPGMAPQAEDDFDDALFTMDGMDEYDDRDANALPSSPSPPPAPPPAVSQKPRTSTYNNRSVFLSKTGSVRTSTKPSLTTSSYSSAHTHSSMPPSQSSSTPETSVSKGKRKATNKKRIHSDIHEQVEMLNDKVESITSGKTSESASREPLAKTQYELKNDRAMVKLDIYCEGKEHEFIRDKRAIVRANAKVDHQCEQEAKTMEIRLRDAESRAWESEAAALCLRIKYKKLMQDERTEGSNAAS
ncbi:uncharacterized protein EDB91DRAFT_1246911 [Suillus paluster]|uniref:uncharacterized protein n=1 Tax=Suillus paluster TaxID=48578 RepID=UPI001B86858D|nr:uncharacterized protein EDB91DRAFT_1246911 [Suillus paluster]KAG1744027.1 hypothetical protein EDB91DRAFT_1246911 [Suillus paluster]